MWAPDAQAGVQFAAVKFLQRVILVQSRGVADPRVSGTLSLLAHTLQTSDILSSITLRKLQNKNDPNIAIVPGDHPFLNAATLEAEGVALLQRLITDLYTKQYVGFDG
jgi:symplekin